MAVSADDRGGRSLHLKRFVQRVAALCYGRGKFSPWSRHHIARARRGEQQCIRSVPSLNQINAVGT